MSAAVLDFTGSMAIEQGTTWRVVATLHQTDAQSAVVNLTGYTARMDIRADKLPATPVLITLSTTNGKIVLGGALGTITLQLTAADTAAFTWTTAVYDLELINGAGEVDRIFMGSVEVDREVTRST